MRLVVTGAGGLIGGHAAARLHAANCAARFGGLPDPWDMVLLDRPAFADDFQLHAALTGADAVLHFAGVNRASDAEIEIANPAVASRLVQACAQVGVQPHVVYANSTHAAGDTAYGRSKRLAGQVLEQVGGRYTNLILPHIFGEGARPNYNNVTATFIAAVISGHNPQINPDGRVELLHVGAAAQIAIDAVTDGTCGTLAPAGRVTPVPELLEKLQEFHRLYQANIYPDLRDPFDVALFNTYRAALYPDGFPRTLRLNSDARGTLFEAVKGGGGGQTFLSTTNPGVTRGDHFHLNKVERFLVVQGHATIRMRRVLGGPVWSFSVTGDVPAVVDMPTLHTHSIENTGSTPLLTLFWTHELFDPAAPDTYADPVLKGQHAKT